MEKFEYKIYGCDDRDLNDETLNEFGSCGCQWYRKITSLFHRLYNSLSMSLSRNPRDICTLIPTNGPIFCG